MSRTKIISTIAILTVTIIVSGIVVTYKAEKSTFVSNETMAYKAERNNDENQNVEQITSDVDTSDWQTYLNEELGFEFKYPNNWEDPVITVNENTKDRLGNTVIQFVIFRKDREVNIQGSYDNAFVSTGTLEGNIAYMFDRYSSFSDLEEQDIVNGKAYFGFSEDKLYGTIPSVTLIGRNHRFGLSYYGAAGKMDSSIIEFKNIISTFKFLD